MSPQLNQWTAAMSDSHRLWKEWPKDAGVEMIHGGRSRGSRAEGPEAGSVLISWFMGSWCLGSAGRSWASSLPSPTQPPSSPPSSKLYFLFNLARDGFCPLQTRGCKPGIEAGGQKGEFYQWFPRRDAAKRNVGRLGETDTPFRFGGWRVGREGM